MAKKLLLLAVILLSAFNVFAQPIQTPDGIPAIERPDTRPSPPSTQDVAQANRLIQNQVATSQQRSRIITNPVTVDLYALAKTAFNLNRYFNYCDQCKKLQYIAFRVGGYYLTAGSNQLVLQQTSTPNNAQLFTAEQQVDGTWAFKSLTQNRYIRATNNGVTINYQSFVGAWSKWYIESHGNHVHIQSAQFEYHWWTFNSNRVLRQLEGGASPLVIEYLPRLQWLWNW